MSAWGFTSAFACLVWAGMLVPAAQSSDRSPVPSTEIIITAQSLVFRNQDNTARFEGKVVMTKGDLVMQADQMVVHFDGPTSAPAPSGGGHTEGPGLPAFGNRAVSLIDATGHVVMQQGSKQAKSNKALYDQRDETLVLTGDPEAWETGYRVAGTKMTMFLKEDRSIVENSRVVIDETEVAPR